MAKTRQTDVNINYKVNTVEVDKANQLLGKVSKTTDDFRKTVDKTKKSTDQAGQSFKKAGEEGGKAFKYFGDIVKAVSFSIVINQLLSFTKQIIAVRGEFQKFEAVLTNTLGSRSAALIALGRINEFAKSTPFGVKELTDNFIKLANRGIQPTVKQMRAIADLSATLGKEFSQVVEAILDINNPERWKEIGIKAETAGNKVKLTFRGVTEEVDRTVEGVTGAVVALGQLNGVAGSTEAISRTLSGQTSNLNDAWEQLLNTIGKGNEGVLFNAVSLLSEAVEKANELLKGDAQRFEEQSSKVLATETEAFEKLALALGDADKAEQLFLAKREERLESISRKQRELMDLQTDDPDTTAKKLQEIARLRDLYDIYNTELPKAIKETITKIDEKIKAQEKAAEIARKAASLEREKELAERRKGTAGASDVLTQTVDLDLKNPVTGEVTKYDRDNIIKAFTDMVNLVPSGEIPPIKQPVEITPMDGWDKIGMEFADRWKEVVSAGIQDTTTIINGFVEAQADSYDTQLSQVTAFYDEQTKLAGDNERYKSQLAIKRDREEQALRKKAFQAEKEAKRLQTVINGAAGVINAFATLPYPAAIVASLLIAGNTAAQLAVINQQQFKGFAKGVIDLKGGTPGKDSIPSMLMPHESVMTAEETKNSGSILKSIRAKKLNDRMMKEIISGKSGGSSAQVFDDANILKKLEEVKNATPDLVKRGNLIYEQRKKSDTYWQWVRSKSMNP